MSCFITVLEAPLCDLFEFSLGADEFVGFFFLKEQWEKGREGKDGVRGALRESVFVDYTRITTLASTLDLFLHTPNYH